MDIHINDDFKACLAEIQTGHSPLFVTGKAGTGKSTLLRYFVERLRRNHVVLAPTGIAALNVGGQTIHSFFGFPPRPLKKSEIRRRRSRKIYEALELIIIDEVSMVRADMMDNIDYFLRVNRNRNEPFGGVQMIFFGDLFQLPPVVSSNEERQMFQLLYESPFFFSAKVFEEQPVQMLELTEVFRQEHRYFIQLLDAVRLNQAEYDELEALNERVQPEAKNTEGYITLAARNATVNEINKKKLEELSTDEYSYIAEVKGDFKVLPAETPLRLKEGAQVMFLRNDTERRYVNGTIGTVERLDQDRIEVRVIRRTGKVEVIEVKKETWEQQRYSLSSSGEIESEKIGSFKQYPLRLAWALTIHKSQGKTFEHVHIDLGRGAFESGQTYVALSRCTTLEGIALRKPLTPNDIQVDPRVVEFYEMALR